MNNHTGSRFTRNDASMHVLMEVIHRRGLFFVDSRTTPDTIALDIAKDWGVPATRRDVFLDNDLTWQDIDDAFMQASRIADKKGHVVVIAHPHELSLRYLEARLPQLQDTTLVPVSAITQRGRPEVVALQRNPTFARR